MLAILNGTHELTSVYTYLVIFMVSAACICQAPSSEQQHEQQP